MNIIEDDKLKLFLSKDAVMGIIPKTKEFEQIMEATFENDKQKAMKTIEAIGREEEPKRGNLFSIYYFKIINELLKHYDDDDAVYVEVRNVLRVETKDFIILLAPRGDLDLKDINFVGWKK